MDLRKRELCGLLVGIALERGGLIDADLLILGQISGGLPSRPVGAGLLVEPEHDPSGEQRGEQVGAIGAADEDMPRVRRSERKWASWTASTRSSTALKMARI